MRVGEGVAGGDGLGDLRIADLRGIYLDESGPGGLRRSLAQGPGPALQQGGDLGMGDVIRCGVQPPPGFVEVAEADLDHRCERPRRGRGRLPLPVQLLQEVMAAVGR